MFNKILIFILSCFEVPNHKSKMAIKYFFIISIYELKYPARTSIDSDKCDSIKRFWN